MDELAPAVSAGVESKSVILWQDFSLTYLYGEGFTVDPPEQHTMTFEYTAGLSFGDVFTFTDFTYYQDSSESNGIYGELTPRFSYNKIFDQDFSMKPVSDVLLATSLEYGSNPVEAFLFGPGIDLKIPGFKFFQLNLFYRLGLNSENLSGGWQLSPSWSVSFPVGSSEIVFDGFIDWVFVTENSNYEPNFHFNSQLKYNVGKLLWGEDGKLYAGIEYRYWLNKYGIKNSKAFDSNDNVVSFLVKYHF
ncbi:MAG: outer membrane protein OmpK [Verrucomicrobiota bacterium]